LRAKQHIARYEGAHGNNPEPLEIYWFERNVVKIVVKSHPRWLSFCGGCGERTNKLGRERDGATTARAVCSEVLSMVHHSLVCIARNSHCALVAEAMNVLGRYLFHKIDIAILNDDAVVGVVDWAS
jgi:hypothetical protein